MSTDTPDENRSTDPDTASEAESQGESEAEEESAVDLEVEEPPAWDDLDAEQRHELAALASTLAGSDSDVDADTIREAAEREAGVSLGALLDFGLTRRQALQALALIAAGGTLTEAVGQASAGSNSLGRYGTYADPADTAVEDFDIYDQSSTPAGPSNSNYIRLALVNGTPTLVQPGGASEPLVGEWTDTGATASTGGDLYALPQTSDGIDVGAVEADDVDAGGVSVGGQSALVSVVDSGQVTLSSGVATVDTGLGDVDATFYLALGIDDPNADAKVAGRLFWDDSAGTYQIEIVEDGTEVGNPTVNYDVLRVR